MMYKETFKLFAAKEGSHHIASEFALKGIRQIATKKNVKTIFEFGIGIGTIPYLLSRLNKAIVYFGTEHNAFCIDAFKKNLTTLPSNFNFNHVYAYTDFQESMQFDFIIMDGDFEDESFLRKITHTNSVIMIEGDRKKQQAFVKHTFPEALCLQVITLAKNRKFSPFYSKEKNSYMGGYTIFYLNPSNGNKLKWFVFKAVMFVRYKLRKI